MYGLYIHNAFTNRIDVVFACEVEVVGFRFERFEYFAVTCHVGGQYQHHHALYVTMTTLQYITATSSQPINVQPRLVCHRRRIIICVSCIPRKWTIKGDEV